jgi:hypothetical protein
MSAGRISKRLKQQSEEGPRGADKRDRDMSHSANGRDILNLCCVGHIEVKYLRALNARCLLLEKFEFLKSLPRACCIGV